MNTNDKGNLAEIKVAGRLVENGNRVSFPHGDGSPYDLIRDDGELHRVQVKHAKISDGSVTVNLHTRYQKEGEWVSTVHSKNTIDEFCVYCPDNGKVYRVPVGEAPEYAMRLRVDNVDKDTSRINWAEEYEI